MTADADPRLNRGDHDCRRITCVRRDILHRQQYCTLEGKTDDLLKGGLQVHRMRSSQIIYILVGGLAFIVGVVVSFSLDITGSIPLRPLLSGLQVLLFLPDSPATAKFLSERDRIIAIERVRDNQSGTVNHVRFALLPPALSIADQRVRTFDPDSGSSVSNWSRLCAMSELGLLFSPS